MSDDARTNKALLKGSKAFLLSLGTLSSRCLGLLRDIAMAALFERGITDAWAVAFRIPNFCRRVFGEGAISLGFIPSFIEIRESDGEGPRLHNLANAIYTLLLIGLGIATGLGILFCEPLLKLILHPRYIENVQDFMLAVHLSKIMFGFVFFIVLYAYFMALLQALGEFSWPAFAPLLFNVAMISFTLMPQTWFKVPGEGLAWGVLVGGFVQAIVLIPILRRRNYFPRRIWPFWSQDLRKTLKRLGPVFLSLGVLQLITLINLYFASQLGEGVISAIYWADRLLELPLSLVSVSLGAASLPMLSQFWSRGEKKEFFNSLSEQMIVNLLWMIPAALGLFFLAEPIVQVLFFRGQFTPRDVEQTSVVLQIHALSLIALSQIRLLVNALSAAHEQGRAAVMGFVAVMVHLLLAPLAMKWAGLQGLMLSTLVFYIVQFFLLSGLFAKRMGALPWESIFVAKLKFLCCCVLIPLSGKMFAFGQQQGVPGVVNLGLCVGVCALSYFVLGRLGRVHPLFAIFR